MATGGNQAGCWGLEQSAFIDASDAWPGSGTQALTLVVSQHRRQKEEAGWGHPSAVAGEVNAGSMIPPHPIT